MSDGPASENNAPTSPGANPASGDLALYFSGINEMGIIIQLANTRFQKLLPEGMLVSHFSVLNHLVRLGDGRTPKSIANAFQVPKTTMTHTLAGLEKAGLVRMDRNPRDARSKCVFLTESGRRFRDEAIGKFAPQLAALSAAFPPERMHALVPHLEALRKFLDEHRDDPLTGDNG